MEFLCWVHRPFGASPHVIKASKRLDFEAMTLFLFLFMYVRRQVLLYKQRVCACLCISEREPSSAVCGTGEKEKKKKVRFFSLIQDTYKEINQGFLYKGFWVLQSRRVEVFKKHLTTLLVSLGSSFFVVRLYLFLESDFLIYCELKFGYKLEYCNLYFIIVD